MRPTDRAAVGAGRGRGPGGLDRPVHRLRGGRAAEVDRPARRPERADRLPQRLPDAERLHQRRLADRLGPVDHAGLGGPLEQVHVELLGHLREARDLVGAGRLGVQPAAVRPVAGRPSAAPPGSASRRPARSRPRSGRCRSAGTGCRRRRARCRPAAAGRRR